MVSEPCPNGAVLAHRGAAIAFYRTYKLDPLWVPHLNEMETSA